MSRLDELIQELCPEGVEYKNVGDLANISRGRVMSKDYIAENAGEYPVYSSQTENDGELGKISTYDFEGEYLTWTTDGANAGSVFYRNGKFSVTNVCGLIDCNNDEILTRYMYHYLSKNSKSYVSSGMGNPKLMSNVMARIKVAVPPLEVQREIVRILDSFMLLTAELTAELTARKSQYEFYRDELLKVDGSIKTVALEEIADIGTGSSNTNEGLEEGLYPFYVRSQEPLRKNEYEYDETAIITAGDGVGVGVGKVYHYVEGKYALHQRAYRIHINTPEVLPKYYFHYMKSTFLPYIQKTMFQGSVASIRRPMLNKFPVPVPSLEVQKKIIDVLENFESICSDLNIGLPAEIEARQKQYEYYRDALLTYAATGKIIAKTDRQTDS